MTEPNQTQDAPNATTLHPAVIVGVLVVVVLGAGALYWFTSGTSTMSSSDSSDLAELEAIGASDTEDTAEPATGGELPAQVAVVNGVAISNVTLEENIAATAAAFAQQGADTTDPALAEQVLTQALQRSINNEVLAQAAAAAAVTVDAAAIDSQFESIRAQFPDEESFTSQLAAADLDRAALRDDIESQLIIDQYLSSTDAFAAIEPVTEAEARVFYEQAVASAGEDVPAFADVQTQIEAQLTQQKQQAALAQVLERLRADADIEVLI